jgi:tetrahydromethanopterin S-methyltransferase subunit H
MADHIEARACTDFVMYSPIKLSRSVFIAV